MRELAPLVRVRYSERVHEEQTSLEIVTWWGSIVLIAEVFFFLLF
jgi:hypothetical protein